MKEWVVRIDGEREDLEALARDAHGSAWSVSKTDDGKYLLRSDALREIEDYRVAGTLADRFVAEANALARLIFPGYQPVKIAGFTLVDIDGRPGHQVVRVGPAAFRLPLRPYADVDDPKGEVAALQALVEAALEDEAAREVIRFVAINELSWPNLYKILEKIEAAVGPVHRLGWASAGQITRLKRTCQDPRVVGDAARHGHLRTDPISEPMALLEARGLVACVARSYIRSRVSRHKLKRDNWL